MEVCIFSNRMPVLVNGSPKKEFNVECGMRKSDPLSPFLLVIAEKGLTRLV